MGTCACPRQGPEKTIDEFWEKGEIHKYSHKDFEIFFQGNKDKLITKETWHEIYFPKVKNNNNLKESEAFWYKIYEYYSGENHFRNLLLSLLLLCGKPPLNYESSFKKMIFYLKLHNLENKEVKKNDIKTIKKSILYEIIQTYVRIVSFHSIEYLIILEPEGDNFIEDLKIKYSQENQNEVIDRLFINSSDNVDIDDFFKKNSASLQNKVIRDELHKIYMSRYKKTNESN